MENVSWFSCDKSCDHMLSETSVLIQKLISMILAFKLCHEHKQSIVNNQSQIDTIQCYWIALPWEGKLVQGIERYSNVCRVYLYVYMCSTVLRSVMSSFVEMKVMQAFPEAIAQAGTPFLRTVQAVSCFISCLFAYIQARKLGILPPGRSDVLQSDHHKRKVSSVNDLRSKLDSKPRQLLVVNVKDKDSLVHYFEVCVS